MRKKLNFHFATFEFTEFTSSSYTNFLTEIFNNPILYSIHDSSILFVHLLMIDGEVLHVDTLDLENDKTMNIIRSFGIMLWISHHYEFNQISIYVSNEKVSHVNLSDCKIKKENALNEVEKMVRDIS